MKEARVYEWADRGLDTDQAPAMITEMAAVAMQRAAGLDGVTLGPATIEKVDRSDPRYPSGLSLPSDQVLWRAQAAEIIVGNNGEPMTATEVLERQHNVDDENRSDDRGHDGCLGGHGDLSCGDGAGEPGVLHERGPDLSDGDGGEQDPDSSGGTLGHDGEDLPAIPGADGERS